MLVPLLVVLAGLLGCGAQVLRPGRCPGVTPMPILDINKYMGVWYEQTHSRRWTGLELKCSLEYFESQQPGTFEVNSFTYSQVANKTFHVRGIAKMKPKQNIQGILSIKVPDFRTGIDGEVWILGTDYTSYTVMWSCMNADRLHFENVVVMTRDPQPSNTVIMEAMGVIIKNKIQHTYMQYTSHRECPTIDPVALAKLHRSRQNPHHEEATSETSPAPENITTDKPSLVTTQPSLVTTEPSLVTTKPKEVTPKEIKTETEPIKSNRTEIKSDEKISPDKTKENDKAGFNSMPHTNTSIIIKVTDKDALVNENKSKLETAPLMSTKPETAVTIPKPIDIENDKITSTAVPSTEQAKPLADSPVTSNPVETKPTKNAPENKISSSTDKAKLNSRIILPENVNDIAETDVAVKSKKSVDKQTKEMLETPKAQNIEDSHIHPPTTSVSSNMHVITDSSEKHDAATLERAGNTQDKVRPSSNQITAEPSESLSIADETPSAFKLTTTMSKRGSLGDDATGEIGTMISIVPPVTSIQSP